MYSTYKCPSCSLTLKLSTASTSWAPPETHGGVDKQAAIETTALVCHWFVDWWLIANYFDMWPRCSPLMPACAQTMVKLEGMGTQFKAEETSQAQMAAGTETTKCFQRGKGNNE